MGKLVDICQSAYPHKQMINFSDKHFFSCECSHIICEECMSAWVLEASAKLAKAAYRRISNSQYDTVNHFTTNFLVHLPPYMDHVLPNLVHCTVEMVEEEVSEESPSESTETTESESTENKVDETTVETHKIGVLEMSFYMADPPVNPPKMIVGFGNDCNCGCGGSSQPIDSHHKPSGFMPVFQTIPTHVIDISLTTNNTDSETTLSNVLGHYLQSVLLTTYEQLDDDVVQVLMDEHDKKPYSSDACDCDTHCCTNCGAKISEGYYLWNHRRLCVSCMYNTVKVMTVDTKLAAEVGLALETDYMGPKNLIADSIVWKRQVIDRYVNAMKKAGACPGISYVPWDIQ